MDSFFFLAIIWVTFFISVLFLSDYLVSRRLKRLLNKEVSSWGGTLEWIHKTNLFDTGPFPKITIKPGKYINAGNRLYYRKVKWKDAQGRDKLSWARVSVIMFFFIVVDSIEWQHMDPAV